MFHKINRGHDLLYPPNLNCFHVRFTEAIDYSNLGTDKKQPNHDKMIAKFLQLVVVRFD